MTFGEAVKLARERQGLTQEELSAQCKVGQTTLSAIERGARIPNLDTAIMISNGLGMRLEDLLNMGEDNSLKAPIITPDEQQILDHYRALNPHGKDVASSTLFALANNPEMKKELRTTIAVS